MNIPSFQELEEIADSRYSLVMLVAKRARELVNDEPALIDTNCERPVSIAIEEALEGAITFGTKEQEIRQREKKEEIRQRIEASKEVESDDKE